MASRTEKGFTLVELMIVVSIIGIISSIAVPFYQRYVSKTHIARAMGETGALKNAYEDCLSNSKTSVGECDFGATSSQTLGFDSPISSTAATPLTSTLNTVALSMTGTISGTFGATAPSPLVAKTITWTRGANGGWTCSTTAAAMYAPPSCPGST